MITTSCFILQNVIPVSVFLVYLVRVKNILLATFSIKGNIAIYFNITYNLLTCLIVKGLVGSIITSYNKTLCCCSSAAYVMDNYCT